MLRRDDELRLSEATQARYARLGDDGLAKFRMTDALQRQVGCIRLLESTLPHRETMLQVAREFGFGPSDAQIREGLEVMRTAMVLFPNDPEVKHAAHYLRHNIHVPCPLPIGHVVPLHIPLWPVQRAGATATLPAPTRVSSRSPSRATRCRRPGKPPVQDSPVVLGDVLPQNGRPTVLMVGSHT